jgi:hypothetical protein
LKVSPVALYILRPKRGQIATRLGPQEAEETLDDALIADEGVFGLFRLESPQPGREVLTDALTLNRYATLRHYFTDDPFYDTPSLFLGEVAGPSLIFNALDFSADALGFALVTSQCGLATPFSVAVGVKADPIQLPWKLVDGCHRWYNIPV